MSLIESSSFPKNLRLKCEDRRKAFSEWPIPQVDENNALSLQCQQLAQLGPSERLPILSELKAIFLKEIFERSKGD
jgi:hypothetical protein